jgi:putative ABC transport system permease protein
MIAILVAVLFTMLLVVGNTMAQAVRERTSELAVLKTLGFSNAMVLALVLAESMFIAVAGARAPDGVGDRLVVAIRRAACSRRSCCRIETWCWG